MRLKYLNFAAGLFALACATEPVKGVSAPQDEVTPSEDQDLIPEAADGKFDTGYLSNLAVELEGTFESELRIDLTSKSSEERQAFREQLISGTMDRFALQTLIDPQVKFAKNQINAAALHLNLSATDAKVLTAEVEAEGFIRIVYQTTVDTIVSTEELAKAGLTLEQVRDQQFAAILPDQPMKMHDKVGLACQKADQTESSAYNYFYYFEPDREGCASAMDTAGIRRVGARLTIKDLAPGKTVYPEYDQLVADGKLDIVVFFGAADHDWEPGKWDWGTEGRDVLVRDIQARNFKRVAEPGLVGDVFRKRTATLEETITVIGPEVLKDLTHDDTGLFKNMVTTNEVVIYNGHSFYGSLDVLNDESIYPPNRYQIFLMSSCWSYEYYTKQIFKHGETEADPNGWLSADVVNDTEMGWFHNMPHVARILITNLVRGAETGGVEGQRFYTWDRIIGAINTFVVDSQRERATATHEIFGVSGVRNNVYEPSGR